MPTEVGSSNATTLSKTEESSPSLNSAQESLIMNRLPKNVIPKRYELKLDIRPENKSYCGYVNIRIYFYGKDTNIVWLHSSGHKITKAAINFSSFGLPLETQEIVRKPEYQIVGLKFPRYMKEGDRAWLRIDFEGAIRSQCEGLYTCPFVDKNGESRLGAATMFAATEARTCFPCFDEPEFKAVFALDVTVDDEYIVVSNMPIMDSKYRKESDGGVKRRSDYFEWTREMSTYLVCIIVGHYEYLETKTDDLRTKVRVYAPWGQREQGRFALEVGKKSLEFFNEYFGKRYPLPKLDLVALSRMSVGAMENRGVITFRETGLITEMTEANPATLQRIAMLVAHEVSHQWFGNLVTMKWWDELYLNEGFATLMQYICVDKLFPEFEVFNKFCADTVIPALGMDALSSSHPIERPLQSSTEINQLFDKITYCKGASVMFMLHEFLGGEMFKDAIQGYMDRFSYDNATTDDLWRSLTDASERDVSAMMNPWIRETGFPVLRATFEANTENKFILRLEQERFSSNTKESYNTLWTIPVKGVYMKDGVELKKFDVYMDKPSMEISLDGMDLTNPKCWLKLNPNVSGFYRVHYGPKLFTAITENLANNANLSAIDRISLFEDQVAMILSGGDSSSVRVLEMVEKFKDFETNAIVWKSICRVLHQFRTLTWPEKEFGDTFDNFCLDILRPVLARIGGVVPRSQERPNESLLRATLISRLAELDDANVTAQCLNLFTAHCNENGFIPHSIRESVFRAVMRSGNRQTFNQMLTLYRQSELAEDRVLILSALGSSKNQDVLDEVLRFSMSAEVHPQETLHVLINASASREGHALTWSFFKTNIRVISERYSHGLFLLAKIVSSVVESFVDQESYNNICDFFARNKEKFVGSEQGVEQAIEHVKLNVIWRVKDVDSIRNFLNGYLNS